MVEGETLDIRKRLWDYSSLIETQRLTICTWRQSVLEGEAELDHLRERSAERWQAELELHGTTMMFEIERRLTLVAIDRCWSDHLAHLERLRDELHLVSLDGRTPLVEFCRIAGEMFEDLLTDIDAEIITTFETIRITPAGVDWEAEGLAGPAATWTYLVNDNVFGSNMLLSLANQPTTFLGAIALWPALLVWGIYQHWVQRRKRRELD